MPITKAAKKHQRQNKKRRERNILKKRKIKELEKEFQGFVSKNRIEEAKKIIPKIQKLLDKAAKIGLIKKNAAARKKSRLISQIKRKSS